MNIHSQLPYILSLEIAYQLSISTVNVRISLPSAQRVNEKYVKCKIKKNPYLSYFFKDVIAE